MTLQLGEAAGSLHHGWEVSPSTLLLLSLIWVARLLRWLEDSRDTGETGRVS